MKQQNNNSSAGCLDILMAALAIVFITLRLCHVTSWPWYWVLAPIWAWILMYVVFIVIGVWMATRKYRNKNKGKR